MDIKGNERANINKEATIRARKTTIHGELRK